jgi:hypothetical protein
MFKIWNGSSATPAPCILRRGETRFRCLQMCIITPCPLPSAHASHFSPHHYGLRNQDTVEVYSAHSLSASSTQEDHRLTPFSLLFSTSISTRSTPHSLCVSQHQQQRQDVFALYSRHVVRGVGRQKHLFRMGSVHDKGILQVRRPFLPLLYPSTGC